MKIDLSVIDREQFNVRDCVIAGDPSWLVFPKMLEAPWTPDTLHFRSIILRQSDGKVLSVGHKKFFNHGQSPGLYPDPTGFSDWRISTKLDGSLIIVSMHRNEMIVRTRGTQTIDIYETGPEVRKLLADFGADKWLDLRDTLHSNSLLFEHCTPSNVIVIPYRTPSLILLDVISHDDLEYWSAKQVDQLALVLGCARPDTHTFGSLDEITETLKTLKGIEGYVLAYNDNRNRVKLKGLDYLSKHRFKEHVSLCNMIDMFFLYGRPSITAFLDRIQGEFDWECRQMADPIATQICDTYVRVMSRYNLMEVTISPLRSLPRRDAAIAIQSNYVDVWKGAAFHLLDQKALDDKTVRKLMEWMLDQPVSA